jgi:GTP:adenosylcobinamide-phosphate guanylyltransferase
MDNEQKLFTAVVLAADREGENPVATAAGVRCKSLVPVNGIPMVFRVLGALSSSVRVKNQVLCGPPKTIMEQEPELNTYVAAGKVDWLENRETPSLSAYHAMKSFPEETPVLLTTSDHALLSPGVVDYFCNAALESGCDVVAGVALHQNVTAAYPGTRRTAYRFKDGSYCSCNLFGFLTPRAREAANFWRRVEQKRKNPLRVVNELGWTTVLSYLMGRLTLTCAAERISQRLGFRAGFVTMPFPEAAIDVDSVSDWRFVERIASPNSS